jgi:hypothetical protein
LEAFFRVSGENIYCDDNVFVLRSAAMHET